MALSILIVPDKFKGTLTAQEAAQAIARGWRNARPDDRLDLLPMSDGGDGFGVVLADLLGAEARRAKTLDAAGRACTAPWWWIASTRTAIIESARAIGLAMLPPGRFHPFQLDTFGLGSLLRSVSNKGAERCIVGLGGSATNDGGFGMARALGWTFINSRGGRLERWTDLSSLKSIRLPPHWGWFRELVVAVDVGNRLLGARGATRVYGPQKGLRQKDLAPAERGLRRLAEVARNELGRDSAHLAGAGAAGGLGFGLSAFLEARLVPGFELFFRHAKLQQRILAADLILTGEGAIDASTLMGKGVGQIAKLCRDAGVPCVGLAGRIESRSRLHRFFTTTRALTDLTSLRQAKKSPSLWLERAAEKAARIKFHE